MLARLIVSVMYLLHDHELQVHEVLLLIAEVLDGLVHEVGLVQRLLHELHVAVVVQVDLIAQLLQ